MKKRLLSLLLAMAMIVSMVPFQALAEEPDETPALLEAAEGIAPEDETTEVTIPETTEETVPETTEETVPETTEETVPETTEETAPETTEELVPETTEELVPETTEETISEVLEETVPELSELILPEGEAPENAPYIVKTRIGRPPVNLAMIENGALAGYTFAVNEADAAYADIKDDSKLVLKDITIPEGEDVVVHVTATSAEGAPVTVEVHVYAATFGIEFFVNDDFSEAVTKHTLNFCGKNSFTLAVKASDGGPLGNVKWTEPSTKLLKRSIDETTGALTYTSTGKTGTAAITVTSRDLKGVSNTLTVNVVKVPESFNVKYPSSTRKYYNEEGYEGCLLTAGQKLSLSTNLPKDTTGKVTWDIVGGEYTTSAPCSLDTVAPEGASADGEDWSAIATIDRNKGVLTTYAGVTAENCEITVRATLTPGVGSVDPITVDLPVLIQPPVESFWVSVMGVKNYISEYGSRDEVAQEGAVNRNEKRPWGYDVDEGSLVLFAEGYQTNALISEVNWKISVSSKVAKVQTPEEYFAERQESYDEDLFRNTLIVTPKAPGKLTFAATSADGSGAKYSGTVEFYGETRVIDISAPKTMKAGDKPVTLTVKAYYDDDATLQIAKPNLYWEVGEAWEIDEQHAKDEGGNLYWDVYYEKDTGKYYVPDNNGAATIKNGKLTLGRITKNTKLLLTAYGDEYMTTEWSDEGEYIEKWDRAVDHVMIDVTVPEGSRSLVIAIGNRDEESKVIVPVWAFTETWEMTGAGYYVVPALMDADGNLEPAEGAKLTVKGSAKKDADDPYLLHFYKDGTATITATLGKQKATATVHVRMPASFVEINNLDENGVLKSTVTAGKSVKLTATSKHTWKADDPEGEWQVAKASVQKFEWYLLEELEEDVVVNDDNWYNYITVENNAAKINTKTGVLTAKNVEKKTTVRAMVVDSEGNRADVTVTILPKDKTYVTVYDKAVPGTYYVNKWDTTFPVKSVSVGVLRGGEPVGFTVSNVTISPSKLAKIENGNIVLTGKTGKATISVTGKITGQSKPVTVKATVNLCNAVTSIEIKRPTNRDGFVPLYVGKSLKLSVVINGQEGEVPATNKKLEWHIGYGKEEGLYYYDKTTIKNGVLKIDNSWFTESRIYSVWATSEDGYGESNVLEIQAYAMTGAINIASDGDWPNDEGYVEYLNNRTVTIKQGETLNLKALVSDVTGYEGANPDVNWSISGNRGYVEFKETFEGSLDTLKVTGKKPGTVTVKATAIDGSKKTATFKLVVKPHTLSAPELETDKLYRSCFTTAPSIAYDYTRGDEVINWLKPTDVEFSSDYSKVKITYDKDGGKWLISVDDNAKLGKVVTITVKDVRTDIEEIDRGQPLSMKFTIVDPQP